MCISPNATAIFGRTCTCSIQAAWNNHIIGYRLYIFHGNLMPPTIPKIILVDKASPFLTSNRSQSYASLILHRFAILWIWLSIVRLAYNELVQMRVLPAHDDLEHLMQSKERYLTRNHNTSPDRRFNVRKLNMQLIDNIIRGISHRCNLLLLQLVPLIHPIVPILNSLLGLLIYLDALQLHQGNSKLTLFPPDQDKHIMFAFLVGSHSHDLDFLSRFQWRNRAANDAAGRKRKLQGVVEIVIPAHHLLFRTIRIHNDLHVNALFTFFIFVEASHLFPPDIHKDQESTKRFHLTLCY